MIENDAHTWDDERTKAEIAALLPDDWEFLFGWDNEGYWKAAFVDGGGTIVWDDAVPAANILLRNAYAWLALRSSPRRQGPAWVRRRELTLAQVNADALRKARVPDPPDVDPQEVEAVYQAKRPK